jgi:hypothetical protein
MSKGEYDINLSALAAGERLLLFTPKIQVINLSMDIINGFHTSA